MIFSEENRYLYKHNLSTYCFKIRSNDQSSLFNFEENYTLRVLFLYFVFIVFISFKVMFWRESPPHPNQQPVHWGTVMIRIKRWLLNCYTVKYIFSSQVIRGKKKEEKTLKQCHQYKLHIEIVSSVQLPYRNSVISTNSI